MQTWLQILLFQWVWGLVMTEYRVFITITFDFNAMQYIHFSCIILYYTLSNYSNNQVVNLWTSNWFWYLTPIHGVICLRKHISKYWVRLKVCFLYESISVWKEFIYKKISFLEKMAITFWISNKVTIHILFCFTLLPTYK